MLSEPPTGEHVTAWAEDGGPAMLLLDRLESREVRMTTVTSRAPLRVWRRVVIGLVGVAAVLVCLLAMNHGAGDIASGSGKVAAVQTAQTPEQIMTSTLDRGANPLSSEPCGVACAPTYEVVAMACVLALLVTVVLLTAHMIVTSKTFLRQILVALAAKAAAMAPPGPPSLYVLSISRT
jgi:phosphate/sulfate permease